MKKELEKYAAVRPSVEAKALEQYISNCTCYLNEIYNVVTVSDSLSCLQFVHGILLMCFYLTNAMLRQVKLNKIVITILNKPVIVHISFSIILIN